MIAYHEPELWITDDNGRIRMLYTDGRKVEQETPSGEVATVKTRWEGKQIVTERETGQGGKLRETYELSPDGKQLIVTLRLDNPRFSEPLTIRRVYDHDDGREE